MTLASDANGLCNNVLDNVMSESMMDLKPYQRSQYRNTLMALATSLFEMQKHPTLRKRKQSRAEIRRCTNDESESYPMKQPRPDKYEII